MSPELTFIVHTLSRTAQKHATTAALQEVPLLAPAAAEEEISEKNKKTCVYKFET